MMKYLLRMSKKQRLLNSQRIFVGKRFQSTTVRGINVCRVDISRKNGADRFYILRA